MARILSAEALNQGIKRDNKKVCSFTIKESTDEWLSRYADSLRLKFPKNKSINRSSVVDTILADYMEKNGNV
jgi:hypothetical protein